jgi:hypothetical protein
MLAKGESGRSLTLARAEFFGHAGKAGNSDLAAPKAI